VLLTLVAILLQVQPQAPRVLSFDAASVKTSTFGDSGLEGSKRSRIDVSPTHVTLRNATLGECLQWAWNVKEYQISAPDAIRDALDSQRYDLRAVVESESTVSQLRLLMQDLLTKRFQLAVHHETRPMPVLELTIAKGGPRLPRPHAETATHSAESLPRVENGGVIFANTTMAEFAAKLSLLRGVDLPVVDRTGIAGVYDITLKEAADAIRRNDAPPIGTFLQEQLGLKLVAAKVPMGVLVVDRVGKLTEN